MIDEAIGKILGMAMAYGASVMGMFVAYVNYRKRIVKADKIISPAAWIVIAMSVLAVVGAVLVVSQLAGPPVETAVVEAPPPAVQPVEETPGLRPAVQPERARGGLVVGILVPGAIFLFATWITFALHRHFSAHGHSG